MGADSSAQLHVQRRSALLQAGSGRWARGAISLAWPVALVAAVYSAVGRIGFNPTDEGYVQAGSYRILLGQLAHRDWISPRPVFSSVIHTVDFLVPAPLFEVSRVIALFEFAGYAILLAWFIYESPPWHWGPVRIAAAAASMLVNLHTFLLTSWYTVDGLLCSAIGLVLV